ncbi:MAG: cell division protein FtsW, partial [Alphaproteobacteria bacterium]|nr:cell division protein FtsW [Alphaproteobacteria bacterium]
PDNIRRLAVVTMGGAVVLMIATLFIGPEIKGATRWIPFGSFSLQPSEFVKPAFAVVAAWMFAEQRLDGNFPGYAIATGLFLFVIGLLVLQPDVGMSLVIAAVWSVQFFVVGLPLLLVMGLGFAFLAASVAAYFTFGHVQARVDRFLDPAGGESYQVSRALEAFFNGGWAGRGPGEGRVKEVLPDAHADFIFAVAGEEFGLVLCLILVALFAFVVLRGFSRVLKSGDLFVLLAVTGLLVQFGVQAIVNMASNTNLIPPKGMTLPFVSYGGSSTLALALGMGMVLALTREQPGAGRSV